MEVGGGEEKRLGGSCGESFLNEGSEQYRPLAWELQFCSNHKKLSQEDLFLLRRGNDILDSVCRIIAVQIHIMTQL